MAQRFEGRLVWRIENLAAPRIEWLATRSAGGPVAVPAPRFDPRPHFHDRVWLALETFHPVALEQLQRRDRRQLRHMYTALMRDIQGASLDQIADQLGKRHPGFTEARAVRREVREGRLLWRQLLAWPWSWFGPGGTPPRDWRTVGPDAALAAAFKTWLTGKPELAA